MAQSIHDGMKYRIINCASKTAADLLYGDSKPGTKINGWTTSLDADSSPNHQTWQLKSTGQGYFKIVNVPAGTAWDLSGGNKANDTPIVGWTDEAGNKNQEWDIKKVNGPGSVGLFSIQNPTAGTFADLYGGDSKDGTRIVGWDHSQGTNSHSKWMFVPLDPYCV